MMTYLKKLFLSIIPKNSFGDKLFANLTFMYFHKRTANASNNFIDVLHRIKISGALSDPLRVFVSDKHLVKIFVSGVLGRQYIVPTLAILNNEKDVLNFSAPTECIVKPCHSSGSVIFLNKGDVLPIESVRPWLSDNYYDISREVNYKKLKKRIIVEPVLYKNRNLSDYKFFYIDGEFLFLQVDVDRGGDHKRGFYDKDFCFLNFSTKYPLSLPQDKPENFAEMIEVSKSLAQYFDGIIRIDLYSNGTDIKVGEITNCHGSARERVIPDGKELILDEYLKD
uniref:Glycosyltransferase n=1 Tax=Shewanella putrefaciens (strain 200) TaxID=399804 RepID=E6XG23_SHEP2